MGANLGRWQREREWQRGREAQAAPTVLDPCVSRKGKGEGVKAEPLFMITSFYILLMLYFLAQVIGKFHSFNGNMEVRKMDLAREVRSC